MITKSDYVEFIKCPRAFWYSMNNPEEAKEIDDVAKKRIDEGNLVNQFAHRMFPNSVSVKKDPNCVNMKVQTEITKKFLESDCSAIAEASFIYDNLFCAVDILKRNDDGSFDIYEVKASTNVKKHLKDYYPDVAFQKYVLEKCGLKVNKCHLLHLNKEYVKNGKIEPNKLLIPYEIEEDEDFKTHLKNIDLNLSTISFILSKKENPEYGCNCNRKCSYFDFCHSKLSKPNLLELNNFHATKAHEWFAKGVVTLADAKRNNVELNPEQTIQAKVGLNPEISPYINMDLMKKFLKSLQYPIYHLDFETMNEAIPPFDGAGPYQQRPFQYSLHIEYEQGGKYDHREFLADEWDSEYKLAKQLCNDIPMNVTSMAFHAQTEIGVIQKLAIRFPEMSEHLNNIADHMVDLLKPFKKAWYYDVKQHGSNSIKYVMPALVPESDEAYKKLEMIHNGGEALMYFPKMLESKDPAERAKIRRCLLKYCEQDTKSMVDVLNKVWDTVMKEGK